MFRVDNGTQSATPPTIPAAGTQGYFQTGVPGTSTIVDAVWATMVQEEPLAVIAFAGLSANKFVWTQLRQAVMRLASANVTA